MEMRAPLHEGHRSIYHKRKEVCFPMMKITHSRRRTFKKWSVFIACFLSACLLISAAAPVMASENTSAKASESKTSDKASAKASESKTSDNASAKASESKTSDNASAEASDNSSASESNEKTSKEQSAEADKIETVEAEKKENTEAKKEENAEPDKKGGVAKLLPSLPNLGDYLNQNMIREILRDYKQDTEGMLLDEESWLYDSENDIYYQLNVPYCSFPSASSYETLSIFVPGNYMNPQVNGDGTYTCTINPAGECGNYNISNAPFIFPVTAEQYDAQAPVTTYDPAVCADYTSHGIICVHAGLRGKSNGMDKKTALQYAGGAPYAVTDLKAAIRFCRLNKASLPGDSSRIFVAGTHEGASYAAITAASGDSRLYLSYLISIGAAMYDEKGEFISDTIFGADLCSPAASPDTADAAYEWFEGAHFQDSSRTGEIWTASLSQDLTRRYGAFINALQLKAEDGSDLTLDDNDHHAFETGSYRTAVETVLNDALTDYLSKSKDPAAAAADLNADGEWFTYDTENARAEITSYDICFRKIFSEPIPCPAYDRLDLSSSENTLFGTLRSDTRHFSYLLYSEINEHASTYSKLEKWSRTYPDELAGDMACADDNGSDMRIRVLMYSPLYFLNPYYDGFGSSGVAPVWRIRSSVTDPDCLIPSDLNLFYSLKNDDSVSSLEYNAAWILPDDASGSANIISWIDSILVS